MAYSQYYNGSLDKVPAEGGAVRVTLDGDGLGQGNDGTSLPCKKVWMITDGTDVRVNIGEAASATLGLPVAWYDATNHTSPSPTEIEIDDLSRLYFYGTTARVIDILYRK
jgi:hypothetical protein